jgi:hypothetical protein
VQHGERKVRENRRDAKVIARGDGFLRENVIPLSGFLIANAGEEGLAPGVTDRPWAERVREARDGNNERLGSVSSLEGDDVIGLFADRRERSGDVG